MQVDGGAERMQISLSLSLPRDEMTVPMARHIVRSCMDEVGISPGCADDIELALTEACTNVLKHSGPGDEYEVVLELDDRVCTISVVDTGHGFDWEVLSEYRASASDERGRGIALMRSLVDTIQFTSRPEAGTVVSLDKVVDLRDDSVLLRRHRGEERSGTSAR